GAVTSSIGRVRRREKRMPWASARTRLTRNTTRPRCSMVSSSPSKSWRYATTTIRSPPSPSGAKAMTRGVYTRSTATPPASVRTACVTEGRKPSASSRRHDRPQRAEASEEGRQQRLEVEEREQAADQPGREAEAHDLEDLGGRQLREEPHLHGADPVAGDRRDDEHEGDPDREVEDLPLERGGLRWIDGAGVTEGMVPVPLDGAEPEEREEHRPEAAGHWHLPGVADEHPAELHGVQQPAEQRV